MVEKQNKKAINIVFLSPKIGRIGLDVISTACNSCPRIDLGLFGANMSYLMPIGYQTNLLVMSAGGYKFSDFLRVGIPLAIIMWVGFSIVLPLLYDLG